LTARPIVVPDTEKISIFTDKKSVISTDGQEIYEVDDEITVEKNDFNAKLALLDNSNFYAVLKNKLHWAISPTYTK
jgi:NAD+ kinase